MVAELGGFVLTHIGQQMFYKQDTHFKEMSSYTKNQLDRVRVAATCMHTFSTIIYISTDVYWFSEYSVQAVL